MFIRNMGSIQAILKKIEGEYEKALEVLVNF